MNWKDIGDGGVKCTHDQGDFDGAIITEASVVQGGNDLWTPSIFQTAKGRKKKAGFGRVRGRVVASWYPGQRNTREQAIAICEERWNEIFKTLPSSEIIVTKKDRDVCLGSGELLPCPMCGDWPISAGEITPNKKAVCWKIMCTGSKSLAPDCTLSVWATDPDQEKARSTAVARWNRRVEKTS